ncbi:MAG: AraC-like DNA-binding protein [Limisphaerales bacterium]|jgi:AraC-like DNA-binding protein
MPSVPCGSLGYDHDQMVKINTGIGKGVLHPNKGQRKFTTARFAPSAALAPFVEHFWTVAWHLPEGEVFVQETLPYPCVHVAFEPNHSEVVCVLKGRFVRRLEGVGRVFGVRLYPGAFYPFLPQDQSQLCDKRIPVNTVFPNLDLTAFEQHLFSRTNEIEMAGVLDQLFVSHLPSQVKDVDVVKACYDLIERDQSIGSVADLAESACVSVRSLQRKFSQIIGVSPKWVIQRIRLQDALERVQGSEGATLASIAADLGYADQAHFTRDFKAVVGVSPQRYKATD